MNKNFIYGLLVGLGVLALVGFRSGMDRPVAGVQKWEYLTVSYKPSLNNKKATYYFTSPNGAVTEKEIVPEDGSNYDGIMLNDLGKEGWELIIRPAPVHSTGGAMYHQPMVFKRPAQD